MFGSCLRKAAVKAAAPRRVREQVLRPAAETQTLLGRPSKYVAQKTYESWAIAKLVID